MSARRSTRSAPRRRSSARSRSTWTGSTRRRRSRTHSRAATRSSCDARWTRRPPRSARTTTRIGASSSPSRARGKTSAATSCALFSPCRGTRSRSRGSACRRCSPRGGSQAIADALASHLTSLGGEIETNARVDSLRELPRASVVLCDVAPRVLLRIEDGLLPERYRRRLERWRYGPGVVKIDYALDAPVPWTAEGVAEAATVHLGASLEEIAVSERAPFRGEVAERPFVLLAQQTPFDSTRAPAGKHTVWAYCHVPNGWTQDVSDRIDAQIERFAPGFRERVLARSVRLPANVERDDESMPGGDISGGANVLPQLLARPRAVAPYSTPVPWLYLCSSSTPPGGGVHGMCGHHAARAALRAGAVQRCPSR